MSIEMLEDLPRRIRRNLNCPMTKMEDRELELMVEPIIEYLDNRDIGSNPPLMAAELFATWCGGDRTEVMDALANLSSIRASCVTAFMMVLMLKNDDDLEAEAFIGAIQAKLKG